MKRRIAAIILALVILQLLCTGCQKVEADKFTDYSFDFFDTVTTIVGYEKSREVFDANCATIKEQLQEYHRLYTIYEQYEDLNNLYTVNQLIDNVHIPVPVDEKILDMLAYAKEMYQLTNGQMNVAMGSVLSIWHRYRKAGLDDPSTASLPSLDELKAAAEHTDIDNLILDFENSTVFLADPEMSLDVGAIAKGYAVEQVALWMEELGMTGYILNVGGNVRAVGNRNTTDKWTVGIENPDMTDKNLPYLAYLHLDDMSLVTSGSYQRYYTVDGKNYHHIIDADTLMPAEKYQSVSVLCENSAAADALSTALFCMTHEEGTQIINSLPNTEAMWVLLNGEIRYSSGFEDYCLN